MVSLAKNFASSVLRPHSEDSSGRGRLAMACRTLTKVVPILIKRWLRPDINELEWFEYQNQFAHAFHAISFGIVAIMALALQASGEKWYGKICRIGDDVAVEDVRISCVMRWLTPFFLWNILRAVCGAIGRKCGCDWLLGWEFHVNWKYWIVHAVVGLALCVPFLFVSEGIARGCVKAAAYVAPTYLALSSFLCMGGGFGFYSWTIVQTHQRMFRIIGYIVIAMGAGALCAFFWLWPSVARDRLETGVIGASAALCGGLIVLTLLPGRHYSLAASVTALYFIWEIGSGLLAKNESTRFAIARVWQVFAGVIATFVTIVAVVRASHEVPENDAAYTSWAESGITPGAFVWLPALFGLGFPYVAMVITDWGEGIVSRNIPRYVAWGNSLLTLILFLFSWALKSEHGYGEVTDSPANMEDM